VAILGDHEISPIAVRHVSCLDQQLVDLERIPIRYPLYQRDNCQLSDRIAHPLQFCNSLGTTKTNIGKREVDQKHRSTKSLVAIIHPTDY
jgi:hypothetical protein